MATDHNFKVKNGLDVLGGKTSIAASTSTSSSSSLKLHVGTINHTGSSALAQFGGFIRASEYYILHENTGSTNSVFIDYVGNALDVRAGEGSYTGFIRANGYIVGTTTVIDSSRNLSNIGSIGSGTITSTGNIVGVGINSTSNYTELGSTSASNLVFKRTNASYIQADGSGGYFIFITNGRSTSYANRALALTTDNNAEFGGAINTVGNVTVGGNLTVNGTTTTLNTATLNVEDKNIVLNYASGDTSSTADGAGITIQDAVNSSTDATISWDASDDRFDFSHMINVQGGGIRALGADNGNTQYSGIFKNLAGDNVLLVRNDKRVLIPGGYLYVSSSEGIYSTGAIRARGGITNDGGNNLSIDSGGSAITFNSKNLTNVGTISSGAITSTGAVNATYFSDGYIQWTAAQLNRYGAAIELQFSPTNASTLVKIGANGSNPTIFNAYTGAATFNGAITTSSGMIVTDTSSTGRGIYRNNTGYDLRLGGGTNSNTGAYISVSGETRGGSNNAYNGRIEYYSGGTGFANQAAILGDHVWYAKHAGGSAHLMTLDSATGDLNLKLGDFEINGTTVIDSSRNISAPRIRTNDGTPSAPTHSFSADTDTGMYRNSDDILGFATGGARRGYFASSGIHSDTNVYTGSSSSFRNYAGTWSATTGLTGNGFNFINSVDGTAMTLSSTGDMTVTNHVAINNFTLSADVALGVRGQGTSGSKYIFSAQDSAGSTKFYVRDDGVTVHQGTGYLYAASSGTSFYSQSQSVFRGNILNDQGDLTLADHVNITGSGALKIAGTQVISSSRALTNITSINATGAIETSSQLASYQGNVSNSFANTSIRLGYSGSASYQQAIKSRHNSGTGVGNAIDFFLWNSGTDAVGDIGTLRVASIETGKGIDIVDGGLQIGASNVITSSRALTNIISADIDGFVLENSSHRSGLLSISELSSQTGYTGIEIKRGNGEHWQLMASDSIYGLYEDTTGHWALQTTKSAGTRLYYSGSNKLETLTDGVEVKGRLIAAATNIDNAFNFQITDSVADSNKTGMRIDYNASDNTTLTTDRTHIALEIDYDVSATGGDTSNEYRAYGINVDLRGAGDTDLRRGIYSYVETQHASGTVSENVAIYGYATADDTGSGRTTNNYGGLFLALENGTGTGGTANHYGVYGRALANVNADKNINNMYGGYFKAEYDTTGATTSISNVYALYGLIDNDSTDTNVSNSYLFYGDYQGTINATNPYGIYIADNVGNIFAGYVRADDGFKVGTTSIINSSRQVQNVTLLGGTSGAKFQSSNWIYDDDNDGRLYFAINGPTYYKSTSGHRFRANGDVTRVTIDAAGAMNLVSGGDTNAPGGAALAVAGTTVIDTSRNLSNIGTITASGKVTVSGTEDEILTLNSTDNNGVYMSFERAFDRHGYVGFGGSNDLFSIVNEESGGSVVIAAGNVTALTLDGTNQNATFAGTVRGTGFTINGTTVIDSGRNLLSIGSISASTLTTSGKITVTGNEVLMNGSNERVKYAVWSNTTYGIGMTNGITYGGIANNYAMTFQMNNDVGRGFLWLDHDDTLAQGAMALTTGGKLTVADAVRIGFGKGDTTTPESSTAMLNVNGAARLDGFVKIGNAGSASDPTIQSIIDPDTGVFFGGGNILGFSAGGSERGRFNASGLSVTGDINLSAGGVFTRSNHHTGHLEGSYINVGANGAKSNPIFTIGSNYNPTESALSNMYGIGYARNDQASFLSPFNDGVASWGLYAAADGDARIFLSASTGLVHSTGGYSVGTTKIVDSSRNLFNIGTINASGTVTLSGALLSTNTGTNAIKTRFISGAASGSTSDGILYVQHAKTDGIYCFNGTSGNPRIRIYGNDGGVGRYGDLLIGTDGSFNISASDTYLILNAANYIQSNDPHNFLAALMCSGTTIVTSSRQLQNVTVTSAEAEGGHSLNGNFGQFENHGTYTNFNTNVNYWGWSFVQGSTNAPHTASGQWYRNRVGLGNGYGFQSSTNDYWLEVASPRLNPVNGGHMYIRQCENGNIGSWYEVGSHLRGNFQVDGDATINGTLIRLAHERGHMEGGHNNIGSTDTKTSPIYTIGSNYNPTDVALSNMYGIGFTHSNASFITTGGASGWGLYVAADGDARVFLSGTDGHVVSTGEHFAGAGNATVPGYTFNNDQNTGMFRNGADNIGFSTNGINRVNVSNTKLALLAGLGLDIETSSGNVRGLIGAFESAPHLRIATSGNESIGFYDGGTSGTCNVEISGAGALTVRDDVTAFGNPSDIRLKENIEIIPNAVEKVQKLEGITFNYKKDGERSTGLIAQQLLDVLPEVVYEAKDLDTQETHYAVRYGNVVGLLVEAIKEQQTQLTAQQEQINQLTNLVNILMEK